MSYFQTGPEHEAPRPPGFPKRTFRRAARFFLYALTALAIAFFSMLHVAGITIAVSSLVIPDIPPPDDADIVLSKRTIPDRENGYFDLVAMPEIRTSFDLYKLYATKTAEHFADKSAMEGLLRDNADARRYFAAASKKPYFQEPYTADPALISQNNRFPALWTWREMSRLNAVEARYLAAEGRHGEAFAVAMQGMRVAQRIQESQPSFITYLTSIGMKNISLTAIEMIMASSSLPANELSALAAELGPYKENKRGLTNAFKAEYHVNKWMFTQMRDPVAGGIIPEEMVRSIKMISRTIYFRPNKTIKLFGDLARQEIAGANQQCSIASVQRIPGDYGTLLDEPWRIPFTDNVIGKLFYSITAASLSSAVDKACDEAAYVTLVETLIALKAYHAEHGALPERLEALVPRYLPEIPEDPFSGKPIRWDPARKILYSVGSDREDDGGKIKFAEDTYPVADRGIVIGF